MGEASVIEVSEGIYEEIERWYWLGYYNTVQPCWSQLVHHIQIACTSYNTSYNNKAGNIVKFNDCKMQVQ